MPYRISYRDTLGTDHLVAVADSLDDARHLTNGLNAHVYQAAGHLSTLDDPMLGLMSRVIQPPQNLDTAGGLPVVYLAGTIDAAANWQATAIAALRPHAAVIVNLRRERPNLVREDTAAAAKWRDRHLWIADIAVF